MLVAFFGFFRKANVCPVQDGTNPVTDQSPVRRCDFEFTEDMTLVWVNLRRTKTIQFGQRTLRVPLPAIPGSVLCPVTALSRLFSAVPSWPRGLCLFLPRPLGSLNHLHPQILCQRNLKTSLCPIGMESARYSGHSFRRGGATFAFQCGATPAQIKEQGDWKSSAYLLYLEFDDPARARVASLMAHSILLSTWRFPGQPPH